jgi:putative Holliday junction resolvase
MLPPKLPSAGVLLAIDPGEKRVGIAVSDPTQTVARPVITLTRGRRLGPLLDQIVALAKENSAVGMVVGLPLLESGERGRQAQRAETLVYHLRRRLRDLPIALRDERWTSARAEEAMEGATSTEREAGRDAAAAAVLLQGLLDEGD